MRRREAYANATKASDPLAYETSHNPLKFFPRTQGIEPTVIKPGSCPKCGKHIGRGLAMHVKHCDGE